VAYIVLHELVHGITMKAFGTPRVRYGFTGVYAFAGSDDYYGKGSYIFIALAPVVLWGAVLAVVSLFVPLSWFWVVHFVQVVNLSDGNFNYVTPQNYGVAVSLGLTARLRHGNVDIVVASYRTQSFDDRPLVITGGDPHQYKIICLKSAGHFRAYFKSRAGLIVPCEMPGLRSTNLKTYPYQKIRHPVYPLDDETTYPG